MEFLKSLNGAALLQNADITLNFSIGAQANGSSGCNRYFSKVFFESGQIKFSAIGGTRKLCPPQVMAQEIGFLDLIAQDNLTFKLTTGGLMIANLETGRSAQFDRN